MDPGLRRDDIGELVTTIVREHCSSAAPSRPRPPGCRGRGRSWRRRAGVAGLQEGDLAVVAGERALDLRSVPARGVADVGNRHVVVLAPEEGHGVVALAAARGCCAPRSGPGARRPPSARRGCARRCADRASARCRRRRRCRARWSARYSSTRDAAGRCARPAASASAIAGRTPTPMTMRSAVSDVPPLSHRRLARRASSRSRRDGRRRPASRAVGARHRRAPAHDALQRPLLRAPTTWTSSLRARSEAATSRPMKLAPITSARLRASPPRRRSRGCRRACAGSARAAASAPGRSRRTGSAPVASRSAP